MVADKIAFMDKGKVICSLPPNEFFSATIPRVADFSPKIV
jgi:ABC-type polar amino acid transport system ATPase subunit